MNDLELCARRCKFTKYFVKTEDKELFKCKLGVKLEHCDAKSSG